MYDSKISNSFTNANIISMDVRTQVDVERLNMIYEAEKKAVGLLNRNYEVFCTLKEQIINSKDLSGVEVRAIVEAHAHRDDLKEIKSNLL